MGDFNSSKPGSRPSGPSSSATTPSGGAQAADPGRPQPGASQEPGEPQPRDPLTAAAPCQPQAPEDPDPLAGRSGRIVHDERGNAIWDWVKETSRIAIDSTSRLLKRLEVPELKVEDTPNDPLSLETERDPGGGYNPYGSSAAPSKSFFGKSAGQGTSAGPGRSGPAGQGGKPSTAKRDTGGGYDPYGKGPTRKR